MAIKFETQQKRGNSALFSQAKSHWQGLKGKTT